VKVLDKMHRSRTLKVQHLHRKAAVLAPVVDLHVKVAGVLVLIAIQPATQGQNGVLVVALTITHLDLRIPAHVMTNFAQHLVPLGVQLLLILNCL